jgi:hypothetical protein
MKSCLYKKTAVLTRIKNLEEAIAKGREYLQTGAHADSRERALKRAEKLLERINSRHAS